MNQYAKFAVAILTAAALGAIVVYAVPNAEPPRPPTPGRHELREDS